MAILGVPLYYLFAVGLSGILKGEQKLGVTFNSNKQDVIDFKKFSKLKMCRVLEAKVHKSRFIVFWAKTL